MGRTLDRHPAETPAVIIDEHEHSDSGTARRRIPSGLPQAMGPPNLNGVVCPHIHPSIHVIVFQYKYF